MEDKIITAQEIEDMLAERFCAPEWAFLPQVRSATGFASEVRTADALAMGLWPSRGLHLHGFEIKVGRSDWLGELKKPEKAEQIAYYCDFWWIVAPKEIIKIEEVPIMWGAMIINGSRLKIIKPAPILKAGELDKLFLAAILRRAHETITPDAKIKKAFEEGRSKGHDQKKQEYEYAVRDHQKLAEIVFNFEKTSGVKIDTYWPEDAGKIGEAVRLVMNGAHTKEKENLQRLLKNAEGIVTDIKKHLTQDF